MKNLKVVGGILIALGLMSAQSALAWDNIITCDNGAAALDREVAQDGHSIYRLVLRGAVAVWALNNEGVPASFENSQGELVFTDPASYFDNLNQFGVDVHYRIANQVTDVRISTYERSVAVAAPGSNGEKYYFNSCSISPQ
jgi:hypothetical protein